MKISLLLAAAILLIGAVLGWNNQQRIHALDTQVVAAPRRNITPTPSKTHSPRPAADIPTLATELIAFARELETETHLDRREQIILDWQRRLSSLNPDQIQALLTEIRNASLENPTRDDLIRIVLQSLSVNHPLETLALLSRNPDLLTQPGFRAWIAADALLRGMEKDPTASIAWFKDHRGTFPDTARDRITEKLLRGTGLIDPRLAFRLIPELAIADSVYAVRMILNPARDTAQRNDALAAFRAYLDTLTDPALRENLAFEGNGTLIANAMNHGLDEGLAWVETAGFTQHELETETSRSIDAIAFTDPAKWLDWLARHIPTQTTATQTIPNYVEEWTRMDHHAAARWLETLPGGPVKSAAIERHHQTLKSLRPDLAADFARKHHLK